MSHLPEVCDSFFQLVFQKTIHGIEGHVPFDMDTVRMVERNEFRCQINHLRQGDAGITHIPPSQLPPAFPSLSPHPAGNAVLGA